MGTYYNFDKTFTDTVHSKLAIPIIYKSLNWTSQTLNRTMTSNVDINNGVDYFLIDNNCNRIVTVQERFREVKYKNFNDFTIRFEREFNPHENRRLSEYYKLNADYFVYGIINKSKYEVNLADSFVKYAVIDLYKLKKFMDCGLIVIDREMAGYSCRIMNGIMHCPVNYNKDNSSSFFPIDIRLLLLLFPNENIVITQKGFI